MIIHLWGVVGLSINAIGALGLLRFTSKPFAGSPLTEEQIRSLLPGMPKARRQIAIEVWGYRLSVIALVIGFILQIVDLLTG